MKQLHCFKQYVQGQRLTSMLLTLLTKTPRFIDLKKTQTEPVTLKNTKIMIFAII